MKAGSVFVSGTFNVLHPGHLRLLKFAKEVGDHLIVGVLSDKVAGSLAYVPLELRLEALRLNGLVDEVVVVEDSVVEAIRKIRPAFVVKGREHVAHENNEIEVLNSYGGKLLFSSGDVVFSSLDLISREIGSHSPRIVTMPTEFMGRRQIETSRLKTVLKKMSELSVVVIGDVIVDEYITCDPLGMSEEDPTIVVTPISSQRFLGGAGIVAAHVASLGAKVSFFSVVGKDSSADFCRSELDRFGVDQELLVDDLRQTTLKQRFRSRDKTLLRVSHLVQRSIDEELQDVVLERLKTACGSADVLIFSDFNYGCLPQPLVEKILLMVAGTKVLVAADSQSSSQIGNVTRFANADLLTPTEREARLAARNNEDGLVVLAEVVRDLAHTRNLIIKLGEQGIFLLGGNGSMTETELIPALNRAPKDVAGAGDCLLVVAALALCAGASLWEAGLLGSVAAAIQVGRVGNIPITKEEIVVEITE